MDLFFWSFLKDKAKDLRKIAGKTQGDLRVEDLETEAWLAAEYHAAKRGCAIDWSDPQDQKLILGTLTVQHVWKKNAERKCTVSADKERKDQEGDGWSLIDQFHSEETADPLVLLERREEEESERAQREAEEAILETYSQSVAYNIILWHFNNIRVRVAAHLAIDRGTLRKRIAFVAKTLKVQLSLFDCIERISESFMPPQGLTYAAQEEHHLSGQQLAWDFSTPR